MMYPAFSPERVYTKSSRFAGGKGGRRERYQDYRPREEVMTFSAEFDTKWVSERDDQGPVHTPQRRNPQRMTAEPQTTQPISNFDTGRVPVVSRGGVYAPLVLVLAMALLVFVGGLCLSYLIRANDVNLQHNRNLKEIERIELEIAALQTEISSMMSESQIANAAMALGMQRVRSSDVIYLTIPDDVVYSLPTDATMGSGHYAAVPGG